MNKKIVLMLVGLICLTGIAYAGVAANYNLSWHVLSGGGGGQMDSASYALSSTVGQIIGPSESSNYRLGAGLLVRDCFYVNTTDKVRHRHWNISQYRRHTQRHNHDKRNNRSIQTLHVSMRRNGWTHRTRDNQE